jgi:hypothetical protein
MSKNNKRKKLTQQSQKSGYKKFLLDMQEAITTLGTGTKLKDVPEKDKRRMYNLRLRTANPVAVNEHISPKELKIIADKAKKYFREPNVDYVKGTKCSTYQMLLLYGYSNMMAKLMEKERGDANHPHVFELKEVSSKLLATCYGNIMLNYFNVITRLSNPCYKYYGLDVRPAAVYKKNPTLEIIVELMGVPANRCDMLINGVKRPTYRLGKAMATTFMEWIKVDKKSLGDYYQGEKETLDVYIQSHAMERMAQRLDLLDKGAINYLLWENTHTITQFKFYKGYILLPVMLYKVKVGYLMAKVVEDKVLFRTFLFIAHNFTPEGDRLRKISGLGKYDITYWHIDRLSTFVKLDGDKYKELMNLFRQAGIKDFEQLKDKDFDIDQLQSVNLDGLMEYITKGKQAEKVQEQEFNEFIANF